LCPQDQASLELAESALTCAPAAAPGVLSRLGFADPRRAMQLLDRLAGEPPMVTPLPASVLLAITQLVTPDRALAHLERYIEASGGRASLFARLDADPHMAADLVCILAHGTFLTDMLVRSPELLYWLFEESSVLGQAPGRAGLLRRLQADSSRGQTMADRLDALRRAHRRELLRIGAAEVLGRRDVVHTGRDLADLADAAVTVVLEHVQSELTQKYGSPRAGHGQPAQFCVVALGKHGGQELNYSSDIDLIFVYDEDGETRAPAGRTPISVEEYCRRLGEQVVRALCAVTQEGALYHVDMRLRPEGSAGPLVRSLRSYWIYYETRGEVWERQMLIKSRRVAGSVPLWRRFRQMLDPFVYPAHLLRPPQEEIRRVKERIESQIRARPAGDNNIKLQPGGIRDIEFIVQCLQLLNGRVNPRARVHGTLTAITRLGQADALSEDEGQHLRQAYRCYRRLENLLQIAAGRSAYAIPAGGSELEGLAVLMGLGSGVALLELLEQRRAQVRQIFSALFDPAAAEMAGYDWVLDADPGAPHACGALADAGFGDGLAAHRDLLRLAGMGSILSRAPEQFAALARALIPELLAAPDPDAGLARLVDVVAAYGAPGMLFDLMRSHAGFRRLLVLICGSSRLLTELIQGDPGLLDALLSPNRQPQESAPAPGTDSSGLRRYKDERVLCIARDDLLRLSSCETTFHSLSSVAEHVLKAAVSMSWEALLQSHGIPRDRRGRPAAFCCFAAGKLGGRELDFGSDLDLLFVYSGEGRTDLSHASNSVFFIQLAQGIIRLLQENGLYRVDARLRPEGASAPLATSLRGYRHYLCHRAAAWERLALSRARGVAGDATLMQNVARSTARFVFGTPVDADLVQEMRTMRQRMVPQHRGGRSGRVHIKRDPGGIVDIEFVAQLLVLRHGYADASLRVTGTRTALRRLAENGHLVAADAERLGAAYERLREIEKALRIGADQAEDVLPQGAGLAVLARAAGQATGGALGAEVMGIMGAVRGAFDEVFAEKSIQG
jgi:[glutamine synthetase] adenylyltransferase / [glutamine synthetase]-adenylyl-L-tyrosine phosphorylase